MSSLDNQKTLPILSLNRSKSSKKRSKSSHKSLLSSHRQSPSLFRPHNEVAPTNSAATTPRKSLPIPELLPSQSQLPLVEPPQHDIIFETEITNNQTEIYILPSHDQDFEAYSVSEKLEDGIIVSTITKSNIEEETPPVAIGTENRPIGEAPPGWGEATSKVIESHKIAIGEYRSIFPIEEIDDRFKNDLLKIFHDLWDEPRFSDYYLIVGKNFFRVHKVVLGSQSSVFLKLFEESRSDLFHVEDYSFETVNAFLRFIYTGEVLKTNFLQLFAISTKYNVTKLRELSEKLTIKYMNTYDVLEVFNIGHDFNSIALKQTAFNEIKKIFHSFELDENLMEKPDLLQKMMKANRTLLQKAQEAEKAGEKFKLLMEQCKKPKQSE